MIKAVKFGGSSLADASQFKKVYEIIKSDPDRKYVVPSAPGKRDSEDIKVTDLLYKCYGEAKVGADFTDTLAVIKKRYDDIISELGLDLSLDSEFETIKNKLKTVTDADYAASRGEYLNGIVLAAYLGYEFLDAGKPMLSFLKRLRIWKRQLFRDFTALCRMVRLRLFQGEDLI